MASDDLAYKKSLSIFVSLCQVMQINPLASEVSSPPPQKLEPQLGILKSSLYVTNAVQGLCKFLCFGISLEEKFYRNACIQEQLHALCSFMCNCGVKPVSPSSGTFWN